MKKKLMSILLVMAMLLQMVPAVVFADDEAASIPHFGYKCSAIGDSIVAGAGLAAPEGEDAESYRNFLYNIKHSYPETYLNVFANGKEEETLEFDTLSDVKSKVDIADLGILSFSAQDYLNILTKPINSSADIVDKYYFWKLISFVDNANEEKELADQAYALKEMQKAILGEIKNSDLVTIQLGADDLVATVLLGLIGSDPSDSAKEILAQLVDVKDGSVDIQLIKGAVSEIIAYLDDPNEEHYTEFAKYIQNLREYRSLVIFIAALDLIQSLKSENAFVKINAFLNFVQTAVKNGILTLDDLKAFLDVFDPEEMGDVLAKSLGELQHADGTSIYDDLVKAVKRINPRAEIAIVGMYNPYGNSIEYKGTRWTNAQIVAAVLAELAKIAMTNSNPGVNPQAPNIVDSLEETENVLEDIKENPDVVEEKVEAAQEAVEVINEVTEAAKNQSESAEKALLSASNSEDVVAPTKEEVEQVLEENKNPLVEGILYAVLHNLLGGAVQASVSKLNYMMMDTAETSGVPFVSVYSVVPNENDINPHPQADGHLAIAKSLSDTLISKIVFDDNLDEPVMLSSNPNLENAVYGSWITINVPDSAQFVVVNNNRVWDATWNWCKSQPEKMFLYKVDSPSTYIYAHCAGATPLTEPGVNGLVGIGDSIATGYTFTNRNPLKTVSPEVVNEDSYVYKLAQILGKTDSVYSLAYAGFGSDSILAFLGRDINDIKLNKITSEDSLIGSENIAFYSEYLPKADTITLHIGANDFLTNMISYVTRNLGMNDIKDIASLPEINDALDSLDIAKLYEITTKLLNNPAALSVSEVKWALDKALVRDEFNSYTEIYRHNMARIAAELDKKISSKTTVVGVNLYNPFEGTNIKLDVDFAGIHWDLPLGDIVGNNFANNNEYLKALMNAYGWKYADITDTEVGLLDPHPTAAGNQYIAEQIAKALGVIIPTPQPPAPVRPRSSGTTTKKVEEKVLPFTDVENTDWFYDNVFYVWDNGIMTGLSTTLFGPFETTTRAQVVTMLYRLAGEPAFMNDNVFADVESGSWYEKAVVWASGKGIVTGYNATTFGPNDLVTREQLAAMLYRYAEYMGYDTSAAEDTNVLSYDDAFSISGYAMKAIQWACGSGILNGSNGKLFPAGNATRSELAAMFHRFCEKVAK